MQKLFFFYELINTMGLRWVLFRVSYALQRKSGLLQDKFPMQPPQKQFITLQEWQQQKPHFFFDSRQTIAVKKQPSPALIIETEQLLNGSFQFFGGEVLHIGKNIDWHKHPKTGLVYDKALHWTKINETTESNDIKYLWNTARFGFLQTLIRHEYHTHTDHAEVVFGHIRSWIEANPINQGLHWLCSQEMGIRILNWTFALYYYQGSPVLNNQCFQQIIHVIYWQTRHIWANINFSKIAVRNNHAISETAVLCMVGTLFPFFPESKQWQKQGKIWLEEEVDFQFFDDGSYLQYSANYQRSVVQMLVWVIRIGELNEQVFSEKTHQKLQKSLNFLFQCQDTFSGNLPNFGPNDGTLLFQLSNQSFADFRPQLNALHALLYNKNLYDDVDIQEETAWYGWHNLSTEPQVIHKSIAVFEEGGGTVLRHANTLTFVKHHRYTLRPHQADALHLDIWHDGENILPDAGTYLYNTDAQTYRYFNGTTSHNTIQLSNYDQMQKGPRFMWLQRSELVHTRTQETDEYLFFEGKIRAFRHLSPDVFHTRTVKKYKNECLWEIKDSLSHTAHQVVYQRWNVSENFLNNFKITALDFQENAIIPTFVQAAISPFYGVKKAATQIVFETLGTQIVTKIYKKDTFEG